MKAMQERSAQQFWLGIAALSGLAAVGFGAWSSHGLEGRVSAHGLGLLQTGLTYHMFHVAGLLAAALLPREGVWRHLAGSGFALGTLCFSGGLYLQGLDLANLGPIIPLGGMLFMAGWIALLIYALMGRSKGHGG